MLYLFTNYRPVNILSDIYQKNVIVQLVHYFIHIFPGLLSAVSLQSTFFNSIYITYIRHGNNGNALHCLPNCLAICKLHDYGLSSNSCTLITSFSCLLSMLILIPLTLFWFIYYILLFHSINMYWQSLWSVNSTNSWWRHQMEAFSALLPLCGEFTGPGEFPAQRPVTRSFDVFFDLRLNKRLGKQPWGWWFEAPSWSLWRQCNVQISPYDCFIVLNKDKVFLYLFLSSCYCFHIAIYIPVDIVLRCCFFINIMFHFW